MLVPVRAAGMDPGAWHESGRLMVSKLIGFAQTRWRLANAPHVVRLARASARFERGQPVERPQAGAA